MNDLHDTRHIKGVDIPGATLQLPDLTFECDLQKIEQLIRKPALSPDDYIGATFLLEGIRYRIEGCHKGSTVIFLVEPTTPGKSGYAMKVARAAFDPVVALSERLNRAMFGKEVDPDTAVAICDQLLEIDPNHGIAAYNKGLCLNMLRKYQEAIDAFDLAIAIEPEDALNWIMKAVSCGSVGRDAEAVDCAYVAFQKSKQRVQKYLADVKWQAEIICTSVRRVLDVAPESNRAFILLEELCQNC